MKNKKIIKISLIVLAIILIILSSILIYKKVKVDDIVKLKSLPLPEVTGGERGELGIDKNINESTIDEYLNRPDSVYRDMRMLEDPGNYEAIGGDRFLSGYVKGFEVVPLPYIIPVTGLPEAVGETYTGKTLFSYINGKYIANYEESMSIIEEIFPKDKVIFLMCGGGGYAGMTKQFLVSLGWDDTKIYNTGGYWFYNGENNIEVKKTENGITTYDFDKVPYHNIEFEKLTEINNNENNEILVEELKISSSKITLEENNKYKLSVIALPNEATDKSIIWKSSDEKIATVSQDGLVTAKGVGKATISAISVKSNKTITCEVIVEKSTTERIILDDISKELMEFNSYDRSKIDSEFSLLTRDENGDLKEEYREYMDNGRFTVNALWKEEEKKYNEKIEFAITKRKEIFNSLIDNKKSFVILLAVPVCGSKDYSVVLGTKEILDKNNIPYIYILTSEEPTFDESKLYYKGFRSGSVVITNKGEIGAYSDPDIYSFKNDEETKVWLNKYITVK